jgi:hypothetical protein
MQTLNEMRNPPREGPSSLDDQEEFPRSMDLAFPPVDRMDSRKDIYAGGQFLPHQSFCEGGRIFFVSGSDEDELKSACRPHLAIAFCAAGMDRKSLAGPNDVRGVKSLGPFDAFEIDFFPLAKCPKPFALNGGEMDKNILSIFIHDEPISFAVVKPFHATDCHMQPPRNKPSFSYRAA